MIETHPFPVFVPKNTKYLLLGSFTGKITPGDGYDFYYSNKRNQFWGIIEGVYKVKLKNKKDKEKLFTKLRIAIADIIYQCERVRGNNLDTNLTNIVYNIKAIENTLKTNKIEKIFFSSKFVESKFRKVFKDFVSEHGEVELVTLPSPSPRYAKLSKEEKIRRYGLLLPKLL